MSTATNTKRRLTTTQVIEVSQWLMQNQGDNPKTAESLASEASVKFGKEIAPITIKKIAQQLKINLRRKHRTRRPRQLKLEQIALSVIELYKLIGADDARIEDVRSKLFGDKAGV